MSRYTFEHGGNLWHVGWDRQLGTYFAQVEPQDSLDGDDDALTDVCGDEIGEVPSVAELNRRLRAHSDSVQIDSRLAHQLTEDRDTHPTSESRFAAVARRTAAAAFPLPATATGAAAPSARPGGPTRRPGGFEVER